jgi:predicted TIM-barrel fold metal-dependent hydrolase
MSVTACEISARRQNRRVGRIDTHVHVTPRVYVDALERRFEGRPPGLLPSTPDELRELMARFDLDAAVVSSGPPGPFLGDQPRANELARAMNEEAAELRRSDPQRLAVLAVVPLPDVDAALAELAFALDTLELDGVVLLSNVAGAYAGDPGWDALFDELHRRRAYVFLHPAPPPHALPLPHPAWLYEFTFDTTRALANLVYSGTLERCPDVRIQVAHLGGTAPFLAHRLASLADRQPELAARAPAGALEYLRRLYYDTGLANNGVALASTREVTSIDHVVFGSDWPYAALPDGGDPAPGLDALGPERRTLVESANAAALVPRFAST